MSWETVDAALRFYDPSSDPAIINGVQMGTDYASGSLSASQQTAIRSALESLYAGSPTARAILEQGADKGDIWIGNSTTGSQSSPNSNTAVIDFSQVSTLKFMGLNGELQSERLENSVIHELIHAITGAGDLVKVGNKYEFSAPEFDHLGPTVRIQNDIAVEMEWEQGYGQAGYLAASTTGLDFVQSGKSYSEGAIVSLAIYDQARNVTPNLINTSSRPDHSSDLIFGAGGNDVILSGAGNDYLYGDGDNDTLSGGSGDDLIQGGFGNGSSNDGVDTADYSKGDGGNPLTKEIVIDVNPGAAVEKVGNQVPITIFDDGYGNTDRLVSIEKIIATSHNDIAIVRSADLSKFNLTGSALEIDMGDQTGSIGDFLDATYMTDKVRFHDGRFDGTGFKILNLETILAGRRDDEIDRSGETQVGENPALKATFGGDGNDKIVGGAGDDLIEGGQGANTITSGSGSDKIVLGGTDDIIIDADSADRLFIRDYDGSGQTDTLIPILGGIQYFPGWEIDEQPNFSYGSDFNATFWSWYRGGENIEPVEFGSLSHQLTAEFAYADQNLSIFIIYGDYTFTVTIQGYEEGDLGLTFSNAIDPWTTDGVDQWEVDGFNALKANAEATLSAGNFSEFLSYDHIRELGSDNPNGSNGGGDDGADGAIEGSSGSDQLLSRFDGVTVEGGAGDDVISLRGGGSNTLLFSKGDGHDIVDTPDDDVRSDILQFSDVTSDEVVLTRSGDDLIVTVAGTGDSVTINWQFFEGVQQGLEQIVFADDQAWSRADIEANISVLLGTDGDDTLEPNADGVTIDGGIGDDVIVLAGEGSNQIIVGAGEGDDTIVNADGLDRSDDLLLEGINSSDVTLSRYGTELTITVQSTGQKVTVQSQFSEAGGIEHLTFANNVVWTRSEIEQNSPVVPGLFIGTEERDRIVGGDGEDFIQGLGGDDWLIAGAGDDVIEGGEGDDAIRSGSGANIVDGGAGVDSASYEQPVELSIADLHWRAAGSDVNDVLINTELAYTQFNPGQWMLVGLVDNGGFGGFASVSEATDWGADAILVGTGDYSSAAEYVTQNGRTLMATANVTGLHVVLGETAFLGPVSDLTIADYGSSAASIDVDGNSESNQIYGNSGANVLNGLGGDDLIVGGLGDDTINGGVGDDDLQGGGGYDLVSYADAAAGVTVDLGREFAQNTGSAGVDTLTGFEALTGSAFSDILSGNSGDNMLNGLTGADTFRFGDAFGNDAIGDFSVSEDVVAFGRSVFEDADAVLAAATQDGDDVVIDAGTHGTVRLENVDLLDLNADNVSIFDPPFDAPDIIKPETVQNTSMSSAVFLSPDAFDLIENGDITSSTLIPHATVNGVTSGAGREYYAVSVDAGDRLIFDIDYGSFDSVMILSDASGATLAFNDDDSGDPGSLPANSFLDYTFNQAGTYFLAVGSYGGNEVPPAGETYALHVSHEVV